MVQLAPREGDFAEIFGRLLAESYTSVRRLAYLSGVSRRTLENWSNGAVRGPRHWEPVVQVARVLHLSSAELDALLLAAGHHSLATLQKMPHPQSLGDLLTMWPPSTVGQFESQAVRPATDFTLPFPVTPFIGREHELQAIGNLLAREDVRHVTIAGPGGIGKTRLAQENARRTATEYKDGVYFISLESIDTREGFYDRLITGFGIYRDPHVPPPELIAGFLHDKQALLIFDTYEHLLSSAAFISDILAAAPKLKVVVTSRAVLRLSSEHVFLVPLLSRGSETSDLNQIAGYASVNLFVTRSRAVRPDFELTTSSAEDILAICRLMDGLPLALELAAARTRVLSLSELRRQLEEGLGLLASGPRDVSSRHRSISETVAWSYALLTPDQQALIRRLSVYCDSFTLAAAEAVATRALLSDDKFIYAFSGLVDQSMVQHQRVGQQRLYRIHDLTRRFAAQQLDDAGEVDLTMGRVLHFVGGLSERLDQHFRESERSYWMSLIEPEMNNVWLALGWGLEQRQPEIIAECLALCGTMQSYWNMRGLVDQARRWTERTLQLAQEVGMDPSRMTKALCAAARLALIQADRNTARQRATAAIAAARDAGDLTGEHDGLHLLGLAAYYSDDLDTAAEAWQAALEIAEGSGNSALIAMTLDDLGNLAFRHEDYQECLRIHQREQEVSQAAGDIYSEFYAVMNLGEVCIWLGRLPEAENYNRQALELARRQGDYRGLAHILIVQARLLSQLGRPAEANEALVEALTRAWEIQNRDIVMTALEKLATTAHDVPPDSRVQLLSFIESARVHQAAIADAQDAFDNEKSLADLRQHMDAAAFADAWDRGHKLTWEAAVGLGLGTTERTSAADEAIQ